MKKLTLAIILLMSFNFLNAQTTVDENYSSIVLDAEKLKEGSEKLNIFHFKTLGEMKTSLKKEKKKLSEVGENDRYYSKVEKEKETLKILNEIKLIESVITEIRNKISSEKYTKSYNFQKTPESVVNHFFNAFKNNDFSKFDYLIDPYGEYSENMNYFSLMSIFTSYLKTDNPFTSFGKNLNFEIINTRIEKDKAFILVNIENTEEKTNRYYSDNSNIERLFTLINRKGNWYLLDISK